MRARSASVVVRQPFDAKPAAVSALPAATPTHAASPRRRCGEVRNGGLHDFNGDTDQLHRLLEVHRARELARGGGEHLRCGRDRRSGPAQPRGEDVEASVDDQTDM